MKRWTEAPLGEAIVDVVLSLNEQAQKLHRQEVATASYSAVRPSLTTFDQIGVKIEEIEQAVRNLPGHPGRYLRAIATAFRYFARSLQGDEIPYKELVLGIQELDLSLIPEQKAQHLRERVDRDLTDFGYKGNTEEKIAAWLATTKIDPDNVTKMCEKFLESSKRGTLARVIGLPPEDGVDSIKSIRGVFWSGYSKYAGNFRGNLTFNIDRPWYEPILAQIMTHEAYPGHQAFYCRWDYLFQQGEWPLEAAYYLINNPTNALFEGGPETALHFLGWDDLTEEVPDVTTEEKRQYILARNYLDMQRISTTNACYLVNTGQVDKTEALAYMERVGSLTGVQAENAYRFFTDAVQKSYYPAYYYGRWMVGRAYDAVAKEQRADYFKILYDTPHTTNTFIDAIRELTGRADFDPFVEELGNEASRV